MAKNEKSNGMTLYQIDAAIEDALMHLCDEDGVIDEETEARLAELERDRPLKIESCALFVKNRRAMADAIRLEELALADRRHKYEADADRVEAIMQQSLAGERFESPRVLVTWRTSQACEIDPGAEYEWDDDMASRFLAYTYRIDKKAVSDALKKGEEIEGARMVTRQHMTIK